MEQREIVHQLEKRFMQSFAWHPITSDKTTFDEFRERLAEHAVVGKTGCLEQFLPCHADLFCAKGRHDGYVVLRISEE